MKRFAILWIAFMLICSVSLAEVIPSHAFTADEQAYNVYLDISTGYAEGVKYLEEIEYLWRQAIELGDVEKADSVWFNAMIAAGGGELDITHMMRYQQLAQLKYGYADYTGLYDHFAALLKLQTSKEMSSIVHAALPLSIEAGYIQSAESLEGYLDEAKAGIRTLMKLDPDYSFTEDLQNYYKELNLLLKYIQDFNATYTDFKAKTENFAEKMVSYEVDFEFIFDPGDYQKVVEARSLKNAVVYEIIYNDALLLENKKEYAAAIERYWQCRSYMDCSERIIVCQNAILEDKYQQAYLLEQNGDYATAAQLFQELENYRDSQDRYLSCGYSMLAGKWINKRDSNNYYEFYKDGTGRCYSGNSYVEGMWIYENHTLTFTYTFGEQTGTMYSKITRNDGVDTISYKAYEGERVFARQLD